MNQNFYKPAIWLMWLALPLTALNYWRVWDRLPARMAVHFDANWQPNGWTSREGALMLALGIMVFLAVVFTIAAYAVLVYKPGSALPVLITFYVALSLLSLANNWIVQLNLSDHNPAPPPLSIEVPKG